MSTMVTKDTGSKQMKTKVKRTVTTETKTKLTTETKKKLTTETKIKCALTRLQKLVRQYYDENPDTTNSKPNNKDTITYYGSALVGIKYNEYIGKWETLANITLHGVCCHFDIRSPIDRKPVKHK